MDKTKTLVTTLIVLVVVMAFILAYVFLVQPRIDGYTIRGYNIGIEDAIVSVAQQASTCQIVSLNLGEDEAGQDQVMNLVWTECLPQELFEGQQNLESSE